MRIFLGGIPLGCDNIGDEAIIACVVKMLKSSLPGVELTVATADASTANVLDVAVAPPFGFLNTGYNGFADVLRNHDAYIWCGATGLSDYPEVGLDLLEIAQSAGVSSFIWGVGMDDELNPVFFKAKGKRRLILRCLGLVNYYENRLRKRLANRIARILPSCRGIWLRDPQSAAMLASMGFGNAGITADSAILLEPPSQALSKPSSLAANCAKTLGLCISAQRKIADMDGLRTLLAKVKAHGTNVLGIPMNPKTDRPILENLGVKCCEGTTPQDVISAAAKCDAILSSRLHLLILAANAGTFGIGIARGSKLDNWLANFGEKTIGSVYNCDWNAASSRILTALDGIEDWPQRRDAAYAALRKRFDKARSELIARLEECDAQK